LEPESVVIAAALVGRIVLMGAERVVVKKLGRASSGPEATLLFFGLATIFLVPLALFYPLGDFSYLPIILVAGTVYSVAFVLYVKALGEGDVSLVTPLAGLSGVFLLLISVPVLGERVTFAKISGVVLVLLGSSLLEARKGKGIVQALAATVKNSAARMMVGATLLMAVGRTIDKWASADLPPVVYAMFLYAAISLVIACYIALRGRFVGLWQLFRERPGVAITSGLINAYSYVLLLVAMKGIEVSVAEPATSLSLPLAVLLGRHFFREDVGNRLWASLVIVAGVWLLFF